MRRNHRNSRHAVTASKRAVRRNAPIKAARYTANLGSYKPWSGAVDTYEAIKDLGYLGNLESFIDEVYYNEAIGEGLIGETELNDMLWFEPEYVCEAIGLYYNAETDEISDEPFEDDEDDYIEESTRLPKRHRRVTANTSRRDSRRKFAKSQVMGNRKRCITKKTIKASISSDMMSDVLLNKDYYIQRLESEFTGTPNTSWENIFNNLVAEFELYADDEVSSGDGGTIKERYDAGIYDANDVDVEFDNFIMWLDANDYDE